jgi:hypothetical protein
MGHGFGGFVTNRVLGEEIGGRSPPNSILSFAIIEIYTDGLLSYYAELRNNPAVHSPVFYTLQEVYAWVDAIK